MPALFVRDQPAVSVDPVLPESTGETFPIVVKTQQGLEQVLADELTCLGALGVRPLKRAVECRGDQRLLYRACYELRTALRVLQPIHSFSAYNEKSFYQAMREVDWSQYMTVDQTLAIDATLAGDVFKHSQYVSLLAKDAIVDQFRERYNRRPSVNTTVPTLRVHVRVNGTHCDVSLDASGDSLHKRSYRRDTVAAPINEVLAAGMVLMSGWDRLSPFADGMCGSGTIAIEAALMALNVPPQRYRDQAFGFEKWRNFDAKLWLSIKKEADQAVKTELDFPIWASDIDNRARNATSINAMSARLEGILTIEKRAFEKVEPPAEMGTLIMNPPYDERLKVEEVAVFYQNIGNQLKHNWPGWTAWILSSNQAAMKHFGLRPSRRIQLINGALECQFQEFKMFAGKKGADAVEEAPEN
jgi:putative N6-adenine-specific DNA methylase